MRTVNDSVDLYTLWKRDEELSQRATPSSNLNAIPLKSDASKFLVPTFSQVFFTDGYSSFKQDTRYERTLFEDEMEVPSIGTDRQNFDTAEMITFDIDGESTRLPMMCKMIIYQQGATNEREPPILVRDVCIQWDGVDRQRRNSADSILSTEFDFMSAENGLRRARSSDYLLDGPGKNSIAMDPNTNRCLSMASSMTEDDDASSVMSTMTPGGTVRHRVSNILRRHKYARQIDMNLVGRQQFYSVPFYQYRGRRFGQRNAQIHVEESEIDNTLPSNNSLDRTLHFDVDEKSNNAVYSVTLIIPVRDRTKKFDYFTPSRKTFYAQIPTNITSKHTTVGYVNTRQFVTIKRTINGQSVDS